MPTTIITMTRKFCGN